MPLLLFAAFTAVTCAWLLVLPLFPSQDAPLHLYYVHIFSELLRHQHTPYTALYAIRCWLPPYATYYYGLVALGRFVPLEAADKLFVCGTVALFAASGYLLMRAVAPRSSWAPFLLLPVLLSWPLFMGFANYMLSIDLACLAIAAWCKSIERRGLRYPALFLLAVLLIVITHPLPWLFVIGFVLLELGSRYRSRGRPMYRMPFFRRELACVALACLPYVYLAHFQTKTQWIEERHLDKKTGLWHVVPRPTFLERLHGQGFSLLHMHGIVLFLGKGIARPYRLGLNLLLGGAVVLTLAILIPRTRRLLAARLGFGSAGRRLTRVWFLYGCLLALAILFVPDNFAGGYYFTSRLQLLLYLCFILAVAEPLEYLPRFAQGVALYCGALSLFVLGLGHLYIRPVARTIVALEQIPPMPQGERPGLLIRPVGVAFPPHLNFDSYNWAPIHYLRWHELPLYNTPWLGESLIPLRLTTLGRTHLDPTFFNQAPQFGEQPMLDNIRAHTLLTHAAFALIQREAIKRTQNPFAIAGGSPTPAPYAQGWSCQQEGRNLWYLCQPHGAGQAQP